MLKYAKRGIKGVFGFGFGFATSTLFVCTMDDLIYAKFRQSVIQPYQLAAISNDRLSQAAVVAVGTGSFLR